jgi:hypothetical protein
MLVLYGTPQEYAVRFPNREHPTNCDRPQPIREINI